MAPMLCAMAAPKVHSRLIHDTLLAPDLGAGAPVHLGLVNNLLRGLNRQQRHAVTHGEGPQLVLAGPGTGKTEVITRRVAWLIATKRAQPRQILGLTFTHKAAAEMQARVDVLVPYGQAEAAIHTFHSFGDGLLREYAFELGLPGDVSLIGRSEAIVLLREHLFELGLTRYLPLGDPTRFLGALVDLFWRAKDEGVLPDAFQAHVEELTRRANGSDGADELADVAQAQAELATAYERYQALLVGRGLIDHSDQVLLSLRLLRERPAVRAELQRRFRYLVVDEFQDSNPAQLEMVLALAGGSGNVSVVGDDDQAIYNFRGAAAANMRRFVAAYPRLARVTLRRNYRCRAPIIASSQRLIGYNPNRLAGLDGPLRRPIAHRRGRRPQPVRTFAYPSRDAEADAVAGEIARRLASGATESDFAVLVRTNAEADRFARSLRANGIAVLNGAPQQISSRAEARVLLAFLRCVADPANSVELYALSTGQPYELGGAELTEMLALARRRHRSLWEVMTELESQPGLLRLTSRTRRALGRLLTDMRAAISMSHERPAGEVLYDFLKRSNRLVRLSQPALGEDPTALADIVRVFELVRGCSALLADDRVATLVPHLDQLLAAEGAPADDGPVDEPQVSVLTVHRAKGLEFNVVFLCGLTDGRFPARQRPAALELAVELRGTSADLEEENDGLVEERRLCYVAMTRARDELWLTYAASGSGATARPSPFIAEALDVPLAALPRPASALTIADPTAGAVAGRAQRSPLAAGGPLSFSQIEDYLACPERFRLRHVARVPSPAHHALVYGRALHQALAIFNLHRRRGAWLSEEALLAAFDTHWSAEGFVSRAHEEARYAAGQDALRRFRREQIATDAPPAAAIERPFIFAIGATQLRGRIDRLDGRAAGAIITDYKSADVREQSKADRRARESFQLQVYALAHRAETGQPPAEVRLHFLDSGTVGRATPDARRLERAEDKITGAIAGIAVQDFPPRPSAVGCGYCPYRTICSASAA